MTALDTGEVLDVALRTLQPDDAPDDANLPESAWTVTDEATAVWALAKIRQARATARRRNQPALDLIAEYQAAIDQLQVTVDGNDARAQATVDHFDALLRDWHRRVLDDDPDAKSIDLGSGLLKSRKLPDTIEVTDPDALLAQAQQDGADYCTLTEPTPKPDKAAIKRWIKATKKVPLGATVVPGERRFEVVL